MDRVWYLRRLVKFRSGLIFGGRNEMRWIQEEASCGETNQCQDPRQWKLRRLEERQSSNCRRNLEKFQKPIRG